MADDLRCCGNLLSARSTDCYHLFPPGIHYVRYHGLFQHCLRYGRHNLSGFHFRRSEDREGSAAHGPVEQHISEFFGRKLLPFVGVRRIGIGTLDKDNRCDGSLVSARRLDCDDLVPPRYDFRDENGLFQHRVRNGRYNLSRLYLWPTNHRNRSPARDFAKRCRSQRNGRFRNDLVGVVLERRPVECDFGYNGPNELPARNPDAKHMVPPGIPLIHQNGLFQFGLGRNGSDYTRKHRRRPDHCGLRTACRPAECFSRYDRRHGKLLFLAVCPRVFRSVADDLRRCGNLLSARSADCDHLFPTGIHYTHYHGLFQHGLRDGRDCGTGLHFRRPDRRGFAAARQIGKPRRSVRFVRELYPFVGIF